MTKEYFTNKQLNNMYDRTKKLLNGENKNTYGFAPAEIQILIKEIERLGNELQVQIEDNARLNEYIERLNNIINELERHLEYEIKEYKENGYDIIEIRRCNLWLTGCYDEDKNILNRLQELKGSDKE